MSGFKLLWCERCGQADDVPRRGVRVPDIVSTGGPLLCSSCSEPLTLLECQVLGTTYRGRVVAFLHDLT